MSECPLHNSEDLKFYLLDWRGIDPDSVCNDCGGSGYKAYGSTATYHGGIGGQMITNDICNWCWGSGDKNRRWPSRKK